MLTEFSPHLHCLDHKRNCNTSSPLTELAKVAGISAWLFLDASPSCMTAQHCGDAGAATDCCSALSFHAAVVFKHTAVLLRYFAFLLFILSLLHLFKLFSLNDGSKWLILYDLGRFWTIKPLSMQQNNCTSVFRFYFFVTRMREYF